MLEYQYASQEKIKKDRGIRSRLELTEKRDQRLDIRGKRVGWLRFKSRVRCENLRKGSKGSNDHGHESDHDDYDYQNETADLRIL